jgi:hypothetical protein
MTSGPCPENETAVLGVGARHGGKNESSLVGAFNHNEYPRRRFASSLKLAPIWSDERVFSGWLSETEAAALSQGRAR